MEDNLTTEQAGVELWRLKCLFFDGENYRWSRSHRAVEPLLRGTVAATFNRALKRQFRSPRELEEAAQLEGNLITMPVLPSSDLRLLLPRGSAVATYVVKETRNLEACRLLAFAIIDSKIVLISKAVAPLVNCELYYDQVMVPAPRKDAGRFLVQRLARTLHGDPAALTHQDLQLEVSPRHGDAPGRHVYIPRKDSDAEGNK